MPAASTHLQGSTQTGNEGDGFARITKLGALTAPTPQGTTPQASAIISIKWIQCTKLQCAYSGIVFVVMLFSPSSLLSPS
jgi:hypothetical protein